MRQGIYELGLNYWFKLWLGAQAIIWTHGDLVFWGVYAALDFDMWTEWASIQNITKQL